MVSWNYEVSFGDLNKLLRILRIWILRVAVSVQRSDGLVREGITGASDHSSCCHRTTTFTCKLHSWEWLCSNLPVSCGFPSNYMVSVTPKILFGARTYWRLGRQMASHLFAVNKYIYIWSQFIIHRKWYLIEGLYCFQPFLSWVYRIILQTRKLLRVKGL